MLKAVSYFYDWFRQIIVDGLLAVASCDSDQAHGGVFLATCKAVFQSHPTFSFERIVYADV